MIVRLGRVFVAGGVIGVAAALLCASGCGSRLPTYPWAGHGEALRTVAERGAAVRTLRSPARLVLTGSDDSQVSLDAALLAQPPDRLRLRAWKMGHAVFDLTLDGEGVWLKAEDERVVGAAETEVAGPGRVTPEAFARAFGMFLGDAFAGGEAEIVDDSGRVFTAASAADEHGERVLAEIDRATRTVRRYMLVDGDGVTRATIELGRYRDVGGAVFPTRIAAHGGEGSVVINLTDPEINAELPTSAFKPPAGAVRQP